MTGAEDAGAGAGFSSFVVTVDVLLVLEASEARLIGATWTGNPSSSLSSLLLSSKLTFLSIKLDSSRMLDVHVKLSSTVLSSALARPGTCTREMESESSMRKLGSTRMSSVTLESNSSSSPVGELRPRSRSPVALALRRVGEGGGRRMASNLAPIASRSGLIVLVGDALTARGGEVVGRKSVCAAEVFVGTAGAGEGRASFCGVMSIWSKSLSPACPPREEEPEMDRGKSENAPPAAAPPAVAVVPDHADLRLETVCTLPAEVSPRDPDGDSPVGVLLLSMDG